MSALYTVSHGTYTFGGGPKPSIFNLRYICLHENSGCDNGQFFDAGRVFPNGWTALYGNLPPVNKSIYVYLWCDGSYCQPDELEEYLMVCAPSDDFRKVCFGEPDYPIELYW